MAYWAASSAPLADFNLSDVLSQVQGLLNPPPQQGQGILSQALGPYGGAANVGLNLLANGGPSPIPRSFGQIVGQSALQAQQVAQQSQMNALQRQLMGLQIAQGAVGLGTTLQRQKALQDLFGAERGGSAPPSQPAGTQPPAQPGLPAQPPVAVPPDATVSTYTSPEQIKAATMLAALDPSKNPQDVLEKQRDLQIKAAQQAQQPTLAAFDNVIKSDSPTRVINANPQLSALWTQTAPQFGIDPVSGFNDVNARLVFGLAGNRIRGQVGLPTEAPIVPVRTIPTGVGGSYQQDAITGKISSGVPQQETQQFVTPAGKVQLLTKAQGMAQGLTPYNPATFINSSAIGPQAHAIATYRQAPPSSFFLKTAQGQELMKQVLAENPNYDATQYQQKQKARNAFATGKQGDIVRSLSVATDHLDQLKTAAAAMQNGDIQGVNQVVNWFKTQAGMPEVTNFNSMKEIVGDEVTKAVIGSGAGSSGDREAIKAAFAAKSSLAQILGTIDKYKGLMGGQLNGLRRQYTKSTGINDFDEMVSDTAKQELGGSGASVAPPVNAKGWTLHVDKNGVKAYVSPDGKSYELAK